MKNEKKKVILAAKFKRDYITFVAVGLFILMVVSELVVAVSIPILINYTNVYAEQETRHALISTFDDVRMLSYVTSNPNGFLNQEVGLIRWDLDLLADVLRKDAREMSIDEVEELLMDIRRYGAILTKIKKPETQGYLSRVPLNFDYTIEQLIERLRDKEAKKESQE